MESIFRILTGRETHAFGEPVIIVTAQADNEGFTSEHFIVLPKRDSTLERSRLRYAVDPNKIIGGKLAVNDIMSAEIHRSRMWLQKEVLANLTQEEQTMRQAFFPYTTSVAEKTILIQYKLARILTDELTQIRQASNNTALRDYLHDIENLPEITVEEEPMLKAAG